MHVWLPVPYRLSVRFPRRQTATFAMADSRIFEVAEVNELLPDQPHVVGSQLFNHYRHNGHTYRPILDNSKPVSLEQLENVPRSRLFYDWAAREPSAFEDHPCARNVTFDCDGPLKHPKDEMPAGSGLGVLDGISTLELDARVGIDGPSFRLDDYLLINGQLMRKAERPTVTVRQNGSRLIVGHCFGIPDSRLPFAVHFSQEHIGWLRGVANNSRGEYVGVDSAPVRGLAAADLADRRTLISAVAVMLYRCRTVHFGRVPMDEMDLLLMARSTFSGGNDPGVIFGILRKMADILPKSSDIELRRVGKALAWRSAFTGSGGPIYDPDLTAAFSSPM